MHFSCKRNQSTCPWEIIAFDDEWFREWDRGMYWLRLQLQQESRWFLLPLRFHCYLSQWSRKPLDARQKKISVQTDRDQMEYLSTKVWLDGHSRFRETGI